MKGESKTETFPIPSIEMTTAETDQTTTTNQQQQQQQPRVFFDVTIGGDKAGTIVMELFSKTAPLTAENFRVLWVYQCCVLYLCRIAELTILCIL